MGLFDRLFGSTETLAKDAELDDEKIVTVWAEYLHRVQGKTALIQRLSFGTAYQDQLHLLEKLLKTELVDIHGEQKTEEDIIKDLQSIEHNKKIRRIHRLEQCLDYPKTRYEYLHELLRHLYETLKNQLHIVEKLKRDARNQEALLSHLKRQSALEEEIYKKLIALMQTIKTFHAHFLVLVKGEHVIQRMAVKENRLVRLLQSGMYKIFANQIQGGITYQWAMSVYAAIEDKVHEGVANEMFSAYHPDIDFEFVNRPEFVDLVREIIHGLRRDTSEEMITTFVHIFREGYNHERD